MVHPLTHKIYEGLGLYRVPNL